MVLLIDLDGTVLIYQLITELDTAGMLSNEQGAVIVSVHTEVYMYTLDWNVKGYYSVSGDQCDQRQLLNTALALLVCYDIAGMSMLCQQI
jgi:hypothetical protein